MHNNARKFEKIFDIVLFCGGDEGGVKSLQREKNTEIDKSRDIFFHKL